MDSYPADIDTVGYEYHAGQFIPCAPYGIGDGDILVACEGDCGAPKRYPLKASDIAETKKVLPRTPELLYFNNDIYPFNGLTLDIGSLNLKENGLYLFDFVGASYSGDEVREMEFLNSSQAKMGSVYSYCPTGQARGMAGITMVYLDDGYAHLIPSTQCKSAETYPPVLLTREEWEDLSYLRIAALPNYFVVPMLVRITKY